MEPLLTAVQIAEILGFEPGTVVDWAEAGKIPFFKVGGRLRFRETEVLGWLEQQREGPDVREGTVSPAPTASPARGVVLQASPAPQGGTDA